MGCTHVYGGNEKKRSFGFRRTFTRGTNRTCSALYSARRVWVEGYEGALRPKVQRVVNTPVHRVFKDSGDSSSLVTFDQSQGQGRLWTRAERRTASSRRTISPQSTKSQTQSNPEFPSHGQQRVLLQVRRLLHGRPYYFNFLSSGNRLGCPLADSLTSPLRLHKLLVSGSVVKQWALDVVFLRPTGPQA